MGGITFINTVFPFINSIIEVMRGFVNLAKNELLLAAATGFFWSSWAWARTGRHSKDWYS